MINRRLCFLNEAFKTKKTTNSHHKNKTFALVTSITLELICYMLLFWRLTSWEKIWFVFKKSLFLYSQLCRTRQVRKWQHGAVLPWSQWAAYEELRRAAAHAPSYSYKAQLKKCHLLLTGRPSAHTVLVVWFYFLHLSTHIRRF